MIRADDCHSMPDMKIVAPSALIHDEVFPRGFSADFCQYFFRYALIRIRMFFSTLPPPDVPFACHNATSRRHDLRSSLRIFFLTLTRLRDSRFRSMFFFNCLNRHHLIIVSSITPSPICSSPDGIIYSTYRPCLFSAVCIFSFPFLQKQTHPGSMRYAHRYSPDRPDRI